jgi:hypothetical protein
MGLATRCVVAGERNLREVGPVERPDDPEAARTLEGIDFRGE